MTAPDPAADPADDPTGDPSYRLFQQHFGALRRLDRPSPG